MKFRVFSDLHLEYNRDIIPSLCKLPPVDYLILAGDIATLDTLEILEEFFKSLNYKKIFYILGNHEYYSKNSKNSKDSNIFEQVSNVYRNLCEKYGIIMLENQIYKIEDITIVGSTLWSDINNIGYNLIADKLYLTKEEIVNRHKESVNYLNSVLTTKTIVITHHMPSKSLIDKKYRMYDSSAFASNCEHLFKDGVTHWIYGHTHTKSIKKINGVELVCNPYGYKNENDNNNYECIIEI